MSFAFQRSWGPKPSYPKVLEYKPDEECFYKIAGPCSVESKEQIFQVAEVVSKYGATHLRGGFFRAGTYPGKTFGFVPEELIAAYQEAAHTYGLKNIIEVLDYSSESLNLVLKYADCLQVGARSMQNYSLLRKLGATRKTIFLKRNPGSTLDEWLGAAEHLLMGGPCQPVLIERGGKVGLDHVRWDLSISMIPAVKAITRMPILVDGSHGTGRRDLVEPMTLAGIAAGADGYLVETHPNPELSLSDKDQAISLEAYAKLTRKIKYLVHGLEDGELAVTDHLTYKPDGGNA